jgi:dihydroorotase
LIDPHVHLRDWEQRHKETVSHGLDVARKAGLDGVFEMPNTVPSLTSEQSIRRRIALADDAGIPIFHGLYAGLTGLPSQVRDMVRLHTQLFPRVVGLKLFAGPSTGTLEVTDRADQLLVFRELAAQGYAGVLAVHCEKAALLNEGAWDPANPITHSRSRPPEAETASIRDMISLAGETDFRGTLHICHISVAESVLLLERSRAKCAFRLTCGVTPHHLLLSEERSKGSRGLLLKVNPPLRSEKNRRELFRLFKDERIDWIETDHAPHTLREKLEGPFPSGLPGLSFYPHLLTRLRSSGIPSPQLFRQTHARICSVFGEDITPSHRESHMDLSGEYDYDPHSM